MKTFENYLQELHAKDYEGYDDDMPDAFNTWLEQFDVNDILDLVAKYEKEKNIAAANLGEAGGNATKAKYGKEHFKNIAKGWPKGKKRKNESTTK